MRNRLIGAGIMVVGAAVSTGLGPWIVFFLAARLGGQSSATPILVSYLLIDAAVFASLIMCCLYTWRWLGASDPADLLLTLERRAAFLLCLGIFLTTLQGLPARIVGSFVWPYLDADFSILTRVYGNYTGTGVFLATLLTGIALWRRSGAKSNEEA